MLNKLFCMVIIFETYQLPLNISFFFIYNYINLIWEFTFTATLMNNNKLI